MATKLQTYKFVNPGVVKSIKTPEVISARKTLVAQNRLGASVSSLGKTVVDLEKITTLRAKAAVKLDIAERRAKRRGQDMAAEEVQEGQLSAYFKDQKKKVKRFKPGSGLMKIFKGIFGWVGPLLSPFVQLATKIFALSLVKEMLEWASDEENIIKLETFLMKTDYVFRKIYGFGEFLIKDNIVAGFESLFGSDETLLGRLKGLGKIILGVTGLKYLLNPFSLMTDILGLIDLLTGNRGRTGQGGPRSGGNTGGGSRPSGYTPRSNAAGNQVAGRGQQYRSNLNRVVRPGTTPQGLTQPKKPSRLAGFKANLQTGTARLPGVSPGAQRALFNAPGKLTNVASKAFAVSKNFLRRIPVVGALLTALYTFLETGNLEKSLFVGAGAALGGALGSLIPIPVLGTLMGEILGGYIGDLFYIGLRGGGMEALGQKLKEDFNKLLQTGAAAAQWAKDGFDRFMRGAPKIKILPDWIPGIGGAEILDPSRVFGYATWGGGFLRAFFSRDPMTEAEKKQLELEGARLQGQAKDIATGKMYYQAGVGYFSSETHRFLGKTKQEAESTLAARSGYTGAQPGNYHYHDQNGHFEIGGKLPEFFLGGLWKGIKKVVSGIGKAVSGVFNAVASVASNPIVSTIASFIPGANIIVPAINAISALSKGDFLGAGLNALGGIANFSAIGSTARSIVNTPDWLLNLRMSKFGMGLSNAYQGVVKFVGNVGGKFANAFGGIIDSRIGKIGMNILSGNTGGAIGEIVGMMPGVAGGLEGFGKFLEENKLQGILGAVPGMGGLMKKIPNIGAIPGMESILGVGDKKFSAFNAMGNIADKVGMKGVYQAILSGAQSGDYIQGLAELAPELGVDPRILGVLNKGKQLLQSNKFNAEYAMQTAIEFLPVPLIVEKLVPAPTPVPINSGDTYVVAPSSTQQER
ncbi:endolysin [Synechococcus phage S-SM1]|uniref:Uncharacterized protein n=1 Tax=Synechococcus phage S-SM1 TaxID=444859 RepID=E3SI27_9CAUD|nr:endolysin [Synechococcus phage S-SM1]ADO97330.1 hypothetical protein SSM1_015 [Synechococcus phage S-SM1]